MKYLENRLALSAAILVQTGVSGQQMQIIAIPLPWRRQVQVQTARSHTSSMPVRESAKRREGIYPDTRRSIFKTWSGGGREQLIRARDQRGMEHFSKEVGCLRNPNILCSGRSLLRSETTLLASAIKAANYRSKKRRTYRLDRGCVIMFQEKRGELRRFELLDAGTAKRTNSSAEQIRRKPLFQALDMDSGLVGE